MYALADEAYDNPGQHQFRYIDRFWLQGGVLGLVIRERCETCRNGGRCDTCVTYVVFRGTSEVGNWFLTNAQAHMRMASDLFGVDALGGVHSGFAKAHVDLWCGQQDPPFSAAESYGALKFAWPLLMALWTVPGWAPVSLRPAELQALSLANLFGVVVLVIAAIQLFLSYGLFEMGFMRTRKLVLGRPLRDSLVEAASNHVVFIGHSLGGALATLAFVDLCVRPTHPEIARVDLVTFGAPQPGNGRFLEWLDALGKKPDRSMAFIANIADPVAYLPPAPHFPKEALRRITPLAALLSAVYYIGWLPYALCYRVSLGTGWSRRIIWRGPDSGLSIAAHFGYSARSPEAQRPARSKREIGF